MNTHLPGDENSKSDVMSGEYEKFYKIKDGDCVLDIGAHVGYFTEIAASNAGNSGCVFAFEPNPRNFKMLKERVFKFTNCTLIEAAASGSVGFGVLWLNSGNSGGHSLHPCGQHQEAIKISMTRASLLILKHVNFVKCDAEGAERWEDRRHGGLPAISPCQLRGRC